MNSIVKEKIPQVVELCKKYSVVRMYLFGSAARDGDFDPATSDIDLLYTFSPDLTIEEYTDNFFELHYALDELFGREVDLVAEKTISNPCLIESIDRDKTLLYGAA
jgi:predicted nucleotidyltransferase